MSKAKRRNLENIGDQAAIQELDQQAKNDRFTEIKNQPSNPQIRGTDKDKQLEIVAERSIQWQSLKRA